MPVYTSLLQALLTGRDEVRMSLQEDRVVAPMTDSDLNKDNTLVTVENLKVH